VVFHELLKLIVRLSTGLPKPSAQSKSKLLSLATDI